jgi:hypothetical protein
MVTINMITLGEFQVTDHLYGALVGILKLMAKSDRKTSFRLQHYYYVGR